MGLRPPEDSPFDAILFQSPLLVVGAFRAAPSHPSFQDSGPIQNDIFVFPRTSVWIQHEGGKPFVTNPNLVTYYNRGQIYRRGRVSEEGDRCEWFALRRNVLLDVLQAHDPGVVERPDRPFRFSHGPSDPRTYLLQRLLVRHLTAGKPADPMSVEETTLHVLHRLLGNRAPGFALEPPGEARHRELTESVKNLLSLRFQEPLSLEEIAGEVGSSVFHLCRVFRRTTGTTVHAYRSQLRLRTALERAADPRCDLTGLGLDLGYSSHSHFTSAFRQAFGITPSSLRQTASPRLLREMARRLAPDPRLAAGGR
jgi:AraC-like DNA-binding protein